MSRFNYEGQDYYSEERTAAGSANPIVWQCLSSIADVATASGTQFGLTDGLYRNIFCRNEFYLHSRNFHLAIIADRELNRNNWSIFSICIHIFYLIKSKIKLLFID